MIRLDQTIEDYHASSKWNGNRKDFKVSSSTLKHAKKSTRDFMHNITTPNKEGTHFDFGNAFELYLMALVKESNEFLEHVAVIPETKWFKEILDARPTIKNIRSTSDYKAKLSEWQEQNTGKYVINDVGDESFELMQHMAKSVISNELILNALKSTNYQVSLEWEDELTGLTCKTRPDLTRESKNTIIDIKTAVNADPDTFSKDAAKHNYPMQAFMQVEGALKTGYYKKVDHYYWLVCEKSAPYHFSLYRFDMDELEKLRPRYEAAMMRAKKGIDYLEAGIEIYDVPSYGEVSDSEFGVIDFRLPSWY